MSKATADLARSITRAGSKQSYVTARLLADRDLTDDCLRAYAYFRWADDVIDVACQGADERVAFIQRQMVLVDRLYRGERPTNLLPEEEIIADLISHDRGESSRLQSFIRNFLAILEFDAHRKGRPITQSELTWYSNCLGKAVTDAIQYFIGNGHPYPASESRYRAAIAAHVTHMLRDMREDTASGYVNVPWEVLDRHDISPEDVYSLPFRTWVRERVHLARRYLQEGKQYLDELDVLRCKLAGYWYCARFEAVLDVIERDSYILRPQYSQGHRISNILRLTVSSASVVLHHITRSIRAYPARPDGAELAPNRPRGHL